MRIPRPRKYSDLEPVWRYLEVHGEGATGPAGPTGATGATGATGSTGPAGSDGVSSGIKLTFSTTTTDADPGTGNIRFNNATYASVTQLYVDLADANSADITAFLDVMDDSTTTAHRGYVLVWSFTHNTKWALFDITSANTNPSGYRKLNVAHIASSSSISNGDTVYLSFYRTGDIGATGPSGALTIVPSCRVYNSGNISTTNNTDKLLTFDSERWDNDSMHSTSSNTERITINTTGLYVIGAHIDWAATNVKERYNLQIRLNGSTIIASHSGVFNDAASTVMRASVSTVWSLTATDYLEVIAQQRSGGSLNITATGNDSPEFHATFLGKVA